MKKKMAWMVGLLLMTIVVMAEKAPVFIYAGQSNADGREYTSNLPDYLKNNGTLPSSPYTHLKFAQVCGNPTKSTFDERTFQGSKGERYAFCDITNYWIDQAMSSDYYAIKCAYGGTAIAPGVTVAKLPIWYADAEWMQTHNAYKGDDITKEEFANNNSLTKNLTEGFASLVDGTLAALEQGYDVKAILWHQGESDRNAAGSYYKNFKTMIEYMRQAIYAKTGDESDLTLPFIFGTVCRRSTQYSTGVEEAQKQVARDLDNVYCIDMKNATLLSDNLHFDRQATEYLGKKMYNQLVTLGLVPGGTPIEVEEFPVKESVMDTVTVITPDNRSWNFTAWSQASKDSMAADVARESGALWNWNNGYGYRRGNGVNEEELHTRGGYVFPETKGLYFTSATGNRIATKFNGIYFVSGDPTIFIPKLTAGQMVTVTARSANNAVLRPGIDMDDYIEVVGTGEVKSSSTTVVFRVKPSVTLPTHIGIKSSAQIYVDKIEVKTPETVTVLIGADQKETFVSERPLDFTPFANLFKAYIVKGYRNTTGNVILEQIDTVPANTPVLLMGEECQVEVPVVEGNVPALTIQNLLTAVIGEGKAPVGSFVLTTNQGVTQFTKTTNEVALCNQAYLLLPEATKDSYDTKQFTNVTIATYDRNRKAAISYTFDDGIQDQYTLAYPEMKKRGLRATFAIIGSKVGGSIKATNSPTVPAMTWDQIREMYADGFEIASHGWNHSALPNLSEEALKNEVGKNDSAIVAEVGQYPLTFVYPGNSKNDAVVAYVESTRVGSRTKQTSFGGSSDQMSMNSYVNDLIKNGTWGVTMIHAIAEGYASFSDPTQLYNHWDYVTTITDRLWVAPFCEVAAYIKERDTVEVVVLNENENTIELTMEMNLNPTLFRQPLTLLIDAYADGAEQDGKALETVYHNGQTMVAGASPVGGSIIIHKSATAPLPELSVPSFQVTLTTCAKDERYKQAQVTLSHDNSAAILYYKAGNDGSWTAIEGTTFVPEEKGVYTFKAVAEGYSESAPSSAVALAPFYQIERTIDLTNEELYASVTNGTGAFNWGTDWGFQEGQEFGVLSTNKIGGLTVQNSNLKARYSYAKGIGLANNYGYTYGVSVGTAYSFADYQLYQNHSFNDIVSKMVHNPTTVTFNFPSNKNGAIKSVDIYEPTEYTSPSQPTSVSVAVNQHQERIGQDIFDLQGRKINIEYTGSPNRMMGKGIYIVQGRKIIIQ